MSQHQDERKPGGLGGVTAAMILLAIAGYLASYTFQNLAQTIKEQGKAQEDTAKILAILVNRVDVLESGQHSHDSRIDNVEKQVLTDEIYLGLRRSVKRANTTPPTDGGNH